MNNYILMASWDLSTFLKNATSTVTGWLQLIVILIGIIMIGIAIFKIASGLISHGKKQINWVVNIILLILGGAFAMGGFTWVRDIAKDQKDTIDDMGKGNKTYADSSSSKTIIFGSTADLNTLFPEYTITFDK